MRRLVARSEKHNVDSTDISIIYPLIRDDNKKKLSWTRRKARKSGTLLHRVIVAFAVAFMLLLCVHREDLSFKKALLALLPISFKANDGYDPQRRPLLDISSSLADGDSQAKCQDSRTLSLLTRSKLDQSLELGFKFMFDHQRPDGNFDYEYDWLTKKKSKHDSSVRQAGALWGLSLIFQDMMDHAVNEKNANTDSEFDDAKNQRIILKKAAKSIKRGIKFFHNHSRTLYRPTKGNKLNNHDDLIVDNQLMKMRFVMYPGEDVGHQGAQALICLALIDFLRACGDNSELAGVTAEEIEHYRGFLDELLPFLVTQHKSMHINRFKKWDSLVHASKVLRTNGTWYDSSSDGTMGKWWTDNTLSGGYFYDNYDDMGRRYAQMSSYSDGESLLACVKAAKYLGPAYSHLWPVAWGISRTLHKTHVVKALKKNKDSDETKGFYQWFSMALFELVTVTFGSGREEKFDLPIAIQKMYNIGQLGSWLLDLAVWMIDVHKTLQRSKNTGYAYEGIVSAYAWGAYQLKQSKSKALSTTVQKLHCTIYKGMSKLIGLQVGIGVGVDDKKWDGVTGLGGIQNAAHESGLRIDVTQHQMHATILTKRYIFPPKDGDTWPWQLSTVTIKDATTTVKK